jgi:hypothetical protein
MGLNLKIISDMFQNIIRVELFEFHGFDFGEDHGLNLFEEKLMFSVVVGMGLEVVLGVFPGGATVALLVG